MSPEVRVLRAGDETVLQSVAAGVFDHDVQPRLAAEFLRDPRHHLAVALDHGQVVGFASGVQYVHPDKPSELFINEVGVAPSHQGRGLGRAILRALLAHATSLGCREAWVLTDRTNRAARRLYESAGGQEAPRDQVMYSFALLDGRRDAAHG